MEVRPLLRHLVSNPCSLRACMSNRCSIVVRIRQIWVRPGLPAEQLVGHLGDANTSLARVTHEWDHAGVEATTRAS